MKVNVYSYDGFGKPELLITDTADYMKITLEDSYMGDMTDNLRDVFEQCSLDDINDLNEELNMYGIFVAPTLEQLVDEAATMFGRDFVPEYHFVPEFGTSEEFRALI